MENMEVIVAFLVGGLMFFSTIAYIVLMIFFPEWVGITGDVAKTVERAHSSNPNGTENS
ncbi:hypothetical protein [Pseudobdellovibrio exovorus]|uniref:Uncharacterized protein n=1 Tax=Pseudobdellovibrio exovorus JSS TaxID=1184267 RepID=M4VA48_9BACT|nr:hypothetical protein [Pseudobdellovibrio exovorus]AGH96078.1 hypothetical protein A11Q_1862 [Pseudobdellovibrio exovorus JSS]